MIGPQLIAVAGVFAALMFLAIVGFGVMGTLDRRRRDRRARAAAEEQFARREAGMPLGHPEWLTRDLPDKGEDVLARLADDTWPADEYLDIVNNHQAGDR